MESPYYWRMGRNLEEEDKAKKRQKNALDFQRIIFRADMREAVLTISLLWSLDDYIVNAKLKINSIQFNGS